MFSLCLFTVFQTGCLRLSYDRCEGENPHPECDSLDAGIVDAGKDGGPADAEQDASAELDASEEADASAEPDASAEATDGSVSDASTIDAGPRDSES
jgi:hypothetical protein